MELLTLKSVGSSGLNTDIASYELPPEYITSGINFRVENGKILPFSGSLAIFEAPEAGLTSAHLTPVRSVGSKSWAQFTANSVWVSEELTWTNISSEEYHIATNSEISWSAGMLGQYLITNHPDVWPEYYIDETILTTLVPLDFAPGLTWKDINLKCEIMRTHKNFLIALGLKGSEDSPNGYRISHPADIDGLPYTWDETDRSSIAIRAQLGSDGGKILDGISLRDSFCIYSEYAIDFLDFNPGSEFYWQRRELSTTYGLLSKDCVVEVNGSHYLITNSQDIVVNNGNTLTSIIDGRIQQLFVSKVNKSARRTSYVVKNDSRKEIWFCQPEGDAELPNMAYIYDWLHNTWAVRTLPDNLAFMAYGRNPIVEGESEQIGLWNNNTSTWAAMAISWGTQSRLILQDTLVGINVDGSMIMTDPPTKIDEEGFDCIFERLDYPLGNIRDNNTVVRVYPLAVGDAFIMQFGSSDYVGGGVRWESEQTFYPGDARKLDLRTTGELFNYRIYSIDQNRFKFSGMLIEYERAGYR